MFLPGFGLLELGECAARRARHSGYESAGVIGLAVFLWLVWSVLKGSLGTPRTLRDPDKRKKYDLLYADRDQNPIPAKQPLPVHERRKSA